MPFKPKKKVAPRKQEQYSRGAVGNFYSSAAWIRLRDLKRSMNPLCEACENIGLIIPMYVVDHIAPITEGGYPLNIDNTQSLCTTCHAIKTGKETAARRNK